MYFKTASRINPATNLLSCYYRLVESYRNILGEVRQRTVLSVGFMEELSIDQIISVQEGLKRKIGSQTKLFEIEEIVETQINHIYSRLVSEKKIDCFKSDSDKWKDWETVDLKTLKNKDIREVGAEWMSLHSLRQLGIDSYLQSCSWSGEDISLAMSHIVSRAVYPASELKTLRFMQDNSSICELTGYDLKKLTKDKLYGISKKLLKEKEGLEIYLSKKTNELFDLQDNIILYDLTNTYFEGEKRTSQLARYGRSKEKRSDCPLVVLALVVNTEGFIKYSAIYQGNMADNQTLADMIDKLRSATAQSSKKAVVVIDAGISTEDNLRLISEKGYDYVCVSRSNLKKYSEITNSKPVMVKDKKNREIELVEVQSEKVLDSEYFLKVTSPAKALKEQAMNDLFQKRFEEGLQSIAQSLDKKGGVKKYDKVHQRIGRLKQKYPSIHRCYSIEVQKNKDEICSSLKWQAIPDVVFQNEKECGVYFLRTSIEQKDKEFIWMIYNCIRNIESSFRTLKTDLDLRPVFHKTDQSTEAHLHLGLLAYWLVNTVRHQLKPHGINAQWREIVRIMNTQKVVTTSVVNDKQQTICIRQCSEPELKAKAIYTALGCKQAPFIRKKSVVLKSESKKNETYEIQKDTG